MKRFVSILSLSLLALLFVVPASHAKKKKKPPYSIKAKVTLAAGQDLVIDVEGDLSPCEEWECYLYITAPKKSGAKEALVMLSIEEDGSYQLRTAVTEAEESADSEDDKAEESNEDKEDESKKDEDEDSFEVMTLEDGTELKVKKLPEEPCDPIELAEYTEYSKTAAKDGKEPADDSWKKLPVLTYEERLACKRRGQAVKTYELDEYSEGDPMAVSEDGEEPEAAKFDKASLQLECGESAPGPDGVVDSSCALVIPAASLPDGDFDVSVNGYWGANLSGNKVGSAAKTGVIRVQR